MLEWIRRALEWAELASPLFFALSLVAPIGFYFRRLRWAMRGAVLLLLQTACDATGYAIPAGLAALALFVISVVLMLRWRGEARRLREAWLERFAVGEPVRLGLPFEGKWKARGTGPSAAWNHHLMARDQWFAVDWVRVDGPSRGSGILAPAAGVVAHVEDGHRDKPARRWVQADRAHPAGNYVSLRLDGVGDVYVILAHLERGSIAVQPGDRVEAGALIGRCGNSGNTTVPHLHLHAQPAERFAPGTIWGLPVFFGGASAWIAPGTIVSSSFSTEKARFPQG